MHNDYLYFRKTTRWQLEDLREFELFYVPQYRRGMESLSKAQIDTILDLAKKNPQGDYWFRTRAEYEYKLAAYRLATATDSQLVAYFEKNRNRFNDIAARATKMLEQPETLERGSTGDTPFRRQFRGELQLLMLENLEQESEHFFPGCLNFQIVQTGDYAVGFIRVPDGKAPPPVVPSRLMMLRKVAPQWYLYRTNWTTE